MTLVTGLIIFAAGAAVGGLTAALWVADGYQKLLDERGISVEDLL